ncbi:SAM-dependent methyltransferase [Methanobrevibacter ruminantium M1]|uniref:SAM-dependent methyltransferase n=1 Tax=Methanobrevibacter ruminantium (strain ATCC 35063 / DSM 1093 / JCM 13430 / OCM 146 / M1) TaxID=634498 RepID=D3E4A9_METRM|nr:class I SAM-dependent methyltransferase [Methanobrevibacter ruminantium]ADC47370.1 SAM-dependent methyltransferase [Methanobrevibacter ruminantium M1]
MNSDKKITKESSILDIGCGNGNFLSQLKRGGYKNLTGIDLFIEEENILEGINLIQTSLEDYKPSEKFDLIVSNHAFEHMDNQLANLKCFENLIKDDGLILLRIPIKSEPIWKRYGVNWFQIDAPRHFFLHTLKSFEILCDKTDLKILDVIFDSGYAQFVFSENYQNDIAWGEDGWTDFRSNKKLIKKYKKETNFLNSQGQGDQCMFVLKKI